MKWITGITIDNCKAFKGHYKPIVIPHKNHLLNCNVTFIINLNLSKKLNPMNTCYAPRVILFLSLQLTMLLVIASYCRLYLPGTYARENIYWATQGSGQDAVNLFFVAPLLLLTSLLAWRRKVRAYYLWSGLVFYISYSYVLYAFACHFNQLFLVYCAVLGLSVFSLIYFFYSIIALPGTLFQPERIPVRSTSIFLLVIGVIFYIQWLSEIIPALLNNHPPTSVIDTGLIVNPVHVLDISLCLPAMIITAILLLKKRTIGIALTPVLLVFCIVMAAAITGMAVAMAMKGLEGDMTVGVITFLMALISIFFLVRYLKRLKPEQS